jgi:hypothetical protein
MKNGLLHFISQIIIYNTSLTVPPNCLTDAHIDNQMAMMKFLSVCFPAQNVSHTIAAVLNVVHIGNQTTKKKYMIACITKITSPPIANDAL